MWRTLSVVAVGLGASIASAQVQISTCGQTVPARTTGVVVNDITCPGTDPQVVQVDDRGKLDLAGFTLSGGVRGVRCTGKCLVFSTGGAGTIRDAKLGLQIDGRLGKPSNLNFVDNERGIATPDKVRGPDLTITGTGLGAAIQGKIVRIANLTITNSYPGIFGERVTLEGASITGGPGPGIQTVRVRLANSTVTGNVPDDLDALFLPRLNASTCDHSSNRQGPTWGVCALD
jgi:hypothetical protein